MKRNRILVFLGVLITCTVLMVSCQNPAGSSTDDGTGTSGTNGVTGGGNPGYTFEEGWYKWNDGYTVMYIYYGSDEKITRAGNDSTEYTDSQLQLVKNTYNYSDSTVRQYLTEITDYFNVPSWAKQKVYFYKVSDGGSSCITCSDGVTRNGNTFAMSVGDTITITGKYRFSDGTVVKTTSKPLVCIVNWDKASIANDELYFKTEGGEGNTGWGGNNSDTLKITLLKELPDEVSPATFYINDYNEYFNLNSNIDHGVISITIINR